MTKEEVLKRKIFLKGQLIEIVKGEISALEQELKALKEKNEDRD